MGDRRTEELERRIRDHLEQLVKDGGNAGRLPRIRDLMRAFGTSQRVVSRALAPLIAQGRITARPGAGLRVFVPAPSGSRPLEGDLVILYRSSESRLARTLLLDLVARLRRDGLSVVQIGFADEAQATAKLAKHGRFRCALLQQNFEAVSVAFLATIRDHADALVIDGVSVTGIDADVIGTNWREALSIGHRRLAALGHRRIGFLTSSHDARQIAMARREFMILNDCAGQARHPLLFQVDRLPGEYRPEDVAAALPARSAIHRSDGYTALIVWGLVDGYMLERALHARQLRPGIDFSVMLLGSVDFPSEHVARFDVTGNSNAEKLDLFESVVRARIAGDQSPPRTHYLPIHVAENGSVVRLGHDLT